MILKFVVFTFQSITTVNTSDDVKFMSLFVHHLKKNINQNF